jgi:hypothetical protein
MYPCKAAGEAAASSAGLYCYSTEQPRPESQGVKASSPVLSSALFTPQITYLQVTFHSKSSSIPEASWVCIRMCRLPQQFEASEGIRLLGLLLIVNRSKLAK